MRLVTKAFRAAFTRVAFIGRLRDNYKIVIFWQDKFFNKRRSAISLFERTDMLFATGRTRYVESQDQRAQVFRCQLAVRCCCLNVQHTLASGWKK